MMERIGGWLAEAGPLTIVGFCAIGAGLLLLCLWHLNKPESPSASIVRLDRDEFGNTFRRFEPAPTGKHADVRLARDTGHVGRRRYAGTEDEGTRRLWPTTSAARSRVVTIGPEGIEDGDHARTARRIRQVEEEHVEEESREDRERREDESGTFPYGEESRAYPEASREVAQARWFRNSVSGEYVFIDEHGRRVDFDS